MRWVFKGGTCLKKVHFETYRFSEDLDFTLRNDLHLEEGFLGRVFSDIAEWIREQSGIEILDQSRFRAYTNKRGGLSTEGRVYYRGPLQQRESRRIKLDLTTDEVLVVEPTLQRISHEYSDAPARGIWVRCYTFAEVFAEKIRALAERGRPRDLYDVINLFRRDEARRLIGSVREVLVEKCRYKGIPVPSLEHTQQYRVELEADWAAMLDHQLPALPAFASFWDQLDDFFAWLSGNFEIVGLPRYQPDGHDELIEAPAGGLLAAGMGPASRSLEVVRFAAANHLCVDLDYRDRENRRATRRIEPYSLRRTSMGNVVLHAVRSDDGGPRTYRVDRILDARVADQVFTPRFRVELTPRGRQSIPPTERSMPSSRGRSVRATRSPMSSGPRFVYRCGSCGKRFTRKRKTSSLNRHKNPSGYPCPGRVAYFIETRY